MKIVDIVKKDIKEYYRESMTFKIVLLSPIIIILVFGVTFANGVPSNINLPMKISICSMEENLPSGFIDSLKEEKWVQVEEIKASNCDDAVKNSIASGNYKGGISIPENFTASVISGNQSYLHIYIDNSLVGVEGLVKAYLWRVLQKYSENFSADPMTSLKGEFYNLSVRLNGIKNSISYSDSIKGFKSGAEDLNANVQSIDTQSYGSDIRNTNTKLENAENQIDSTNSEIESFRGNIQLYTAQLSDVKTDLIKYDNQTLQVKGVLSVLYNSTCRTGVPVFPDTQEACNNISSVIQQLDQTHQDLQQKTQMVDNMTANLKQADSDLKDREALLTQMKGEIEDSRRSLENISTNFAYLESMKNETKNFTNQIDYYSNNVKSEENNMKNDMGNFSGRINELLMGMTALPLNPIQIDTKDVFENLSFLDFVIPSLITLLVMFSSLFLASTTIIAERISGTLTRNLLTPVSLSNFIFGKILSIILIGLTELTTILIIGFFAFHIYIPSLIPQLVMFILLSLFSFSIIGMFIGIWSDSGITAVLISITFMIVLLFISGITIPNEMLPENVVTAGKFLPLSNTFSLIKGLFMYNIIDWGSITYLAVLSISGLAICIFSIKKQIG